MAFLRYDLHFRGEFQAHTDWISSIAFEEKQGDVFISASRDGTVRIWDWKAMSKEMPEGGCGHFLRGRGAGAGNEYKVSSKVLERHRGPVSRAAISQDGKHAVSSSWDRTLMYWSLEEARHLRTFKGHQNHVNDVCFTNDDCTQFLSASSDGTARLWDTTGTQRNSLGSAPTPDPAPDGNRGRGRGRGGARGGAKEPCTASARIHDDWVSAVVHAPPSSKTAVACTSGWDKCIHVWDSSTCKVQSSMPLKHTAAIYALEISPDASLLASGGRDCFVLLWDVKEATFLYSLGVESCVNSLAFNPTRYWLAVAMDRGAVVFDLEDKKQFASMTPSGKASDAIATTVRWDSSGDHLFLGYSNGVIEVHQRDEYGRYR